GAQQAPDGVHEVVGRDGYPVLPGRLAEVERVGRAVLGHFPAFGDTGHDLAAVEAHETFGEVVEDVAAHVVGDPAGVQRSRLEVVRIGQDLLGGFLRRGGPAALGTPAGTLAGPARTGTRCHED